MYTACSVGTSEFFLITTLLVSGDPVQLSPSGTDSGCYCEMPTLVDMQAIFPVYL